MAFETLNRLLQTMNRIFGFEVKLLLIPVVVAVAVAIIFFVIRSLVLRLLGRWSARTKTRMDDLVVSCVRGPSILWCIVLSIQVGFGASSIPVKYAGYLTRGLDVFIVFSITMVVANLSGRTLQHLLDSSHRVFLLNQQGSSMAF